MKSGSLFILLSLVINILFIIFICFSYLFKYNNKKFLKTFYYVSGVPLVIAVILLFAAFLSDRFDLVYVYNYSSADLPVYYKISAFWAGQEGTFLLWSFILFIMGFIEAGKDNDYKKIILPTVALTQIFILVLLVKQSPFKAFSANAVPMDGAGLNPLLQDPWMIIHPPVLFLGYASASLVFAYSIAGLIKRDYAGWGVESYRWVVFCMTFLGIGIFMGGYWAYKVLGWGGYWGWDPVENSSLIPWLITAALMHSLLIQKRRKVLIKTNFFLSALSLALVFYGTFLTRSGVLSDFSVHSFTDYGLSKFLIFYIIAFIITGFGLLVFRFNDINTAFRNKLDKEIFTSTNTLNYGSILLIIFSMFILLGTSMPVLTKIFSPVPANVSQDFYNLLIKPFGILILLSVIIASVYSSAEKNIGRILVAALISIIIALVINIAFNFYLISMVFCSLGFFIIIQNVYYILNEKTAKLGSRLAHIGIGILAIGIVASNLHSFSVQKDIKKDVETEFGEVCLTFLGYDSAGNALKLFYKNKSKEIHTPYYLDTKTNSFVKEPYIDYGIIEDIYISPVDYKENPGNELILSKLRETEFNGMKFTFLEFVIENMTSGNPAVYMMLKTGSEGREQVLKPGILMSKDKSRKHIDAKIKGTGLTVSVLDFDIAGKKILIKITDSAGKAEIIPSAIIDVSFKRLVWLVWLGTVLMAAGGSYALKKRR